MRSAERGDDAAGDAGHEVADDQHHHHGQDVGRQAQDLIEGSLKARDDDLLPTRDCVQRVLGHDVPLSLKRELCCDATGYKPVRRRRRWVTRHSMSARRRAERHMVLRLFFFARQGGVQMARDRERHQMHYGQGKVSDREEDTFEQQVGKMHCQQRLVQALVDLGVELARRRGDFAMRQVVPRGRWP